MLRYRVIIGTICVTLFTQPVYAVTLPWQGGYCVLWHNESADVDPDDYYWDTDNGILRLDAPGLWEAEYYDPSWNFGDCRNLYTSSILGDYFELRLWAHYILNDLNLDNVGTAQNLAKLTLVRVAGQDAYGFLYADGTTLYHSVIEGNAGPIVTQKLGGWGMDIEGHLSSAAFDEIESGTLHVFGNVLAGGLTIDGDVSGSVQIDGRAWGPIHVGGDLCGSLQIGEDVSDSITIDGAQSGSLIAIGGSLSGTLEVQTLPEGDTFITTLDSTGVVRMTGMHHTGVMQIGTMLPYSLVELDCASHMGTVRVLQDARRGQSGSLTTIR